MNKKHQTQEILLTNCDNNRRHMLHFLLNRQVIRYTLQTPLTAYTTRCQLHLSVSDKYLVAFTSDCAHAAFQNKLRFSFSDCFFRQRISWKGKFLSPTYS